ncbi:MAG: hypothetical protein V9G19_21845 [Tetrasphaera sp.]
MALTADEMGRAVAEAERRDPALGALFALGFYTGRSVTWATRHGLIWRTTYR